MDGKEALSLPQDNLIAPLAVNLGNAAGHGGLVACTFETRFSAKFSIGYRTLRDHAFTVTVGHIKKAQKTGKPSSISLADHGAAGRERRRVRGAAGYYRLHHRRGHPRRRRQEPGR